jgi:hypothetical protein
MLNTRHPLYVVSRYGYVLESTPSIDSLFVSDWSIRPDFILIKREDIPLLQGMATIIGLDVVNVELLDTPNPIESLYLETRILLTHQCPKHRLSAIIRRIPSPLYGWNSRDTLYLISVE